MSFRKIFGGILSAVALGTVLWACHVANEAQAFMEVHADSTWSPLARGE